MLAGFFVSDTWRNERYIRFYWKLGAVGLFQWGVEQNFLGSEAESGK